MGTKAVPTAELELQGTEAILVGEPCRGVKLITSMINITRIYSGSGSLSAIRRSIAIARDYAHRRKAFGSLLSTKPLHLATLASMELDFRACIGFFFDVIKLLGHEECHKLDSSQSILLRFLCPLFKLFTAKRAVEVTSEAMECLGGTGYMEDTDLPRIHRDVQVNTIWEGTTNVLALDVWRAITREKALDIFSNNVRNRLNILIAPPSLKKSLNLVTLALDNILQYGKKLLESGRTEFIEATARHFSYGLARIYCGLVLLEHAVWAEANHFDAPINIVAAQRWSENLGVQPHFDNLANTLLEDRTLALDLDQVGNPRGHGDVDQRGKVRSKM
eukprot:TRINITY_DN1605_c0_g1_i5.p1 TRINITY_DN1605_c0_g1~~TRINITY_DN1605_c0_g1_i5.p1  ORF type:complete len:333 (-),score=49.49 TRINITY_DN1605_c0_g1_i5:23-1021(-)